MITQYPPSGLLGTTEAGTTKAVPVSAEGHLEVEIHGPINPFGSVHVESLYPIFQVDGVTGIQNAEVTTTTGLAVGSGSGSGAISTSSNMFVASTGTTQYSFSSLQSRKRLRYRPGQGVVTRFTALWSTPVASSVVVAGVGSGESGFYFGYNGTSFGILHSTGGKREVQTMTVTTASTTTENITVTLGGIAHTVAVTNSGSTVKTAYEISKGTYQGWSANQRGSTVVFLAASVGNKTGTFSTTATSAVTSFVETLAGTASTDTWIAQADWNGDSLDGTGPSGVTLDPTMGNVFQMDIQYLGFGACTFKVETTSSDGNNATWTIVHTLKFPNTLTAPSVSNPSFPFTMAAYSAGSTTNVSVSVGSFAGFIEGQKVNSGPRMSYGTTSTAVSTGSYYCLATIRNDITYQSKANQSVINLLSFGGAHDDATPVTLFLIRNATLVGTPNFAVWSPNSCTYVDTAATTCTITDNEQVIVRIPIGQGGGAIWYPSDDITIQPGETVTIAAQTVTGTSTYTIFTLNTREDH